MTLREAFRPTRGLATTAAVLLGAMSAAAQAQTSATTPQPPTAQPAPQVIEPQVARRDIKPPQFPSNDIEFGVFGGSYATENFGTNGVAGVRLGYHITEDFFVTGQYAETKVSDEAFRNLFPGAGIFRERSEKLKYWTVSIGYNVISGEAFFGRNTAKPLQGYILAGIGSTNFAGQKKQTVDVGFGLRLYLSDRFAIQADVRDHLYSLDLLGQRRNTQNIEATAGLTVFF